MEIIQSELLCLTCASLSRCPAKVLQHVPFHIYELRGSQIHNGAAKGFILSIQKKPVLLVTSIC